MSKRALGPQEVDTATPQAYPHLSQNLKGAQIAKEKEAEIQRLNEIQAERVENTVSISKFKAVPRPSARGGGPMSWEDKMERACMVGDQPMLNQVLKHVPPNCALSDGWFPVALSAASGQLDMLKAVLKGAKGDAERRLADGSTPLRLAAERGHAECVDCLLKIGADKDVTQALRRAADGGHLAVVHRILAHSGALLAGLPHTSLHRLQQLGARGKDGAPDVRSLPQNLRHTFRRIETREALLDSFEQAAKGGDEAAMRKALRDASLDANVQFASGWTALGLVAAADKPQAVELLLDAGAKVDAAMADGRTALEIATACGHIDVATLLINGKSGHSPRPRNSSRRRKKLAKPAAVSSSPRVAHPPAPLAGHGGSARQHGSAHRLAAGGGSGGALEGDGRAPLDHHKSSRHLARDVAVIVALERHDAAHAGLHDAQGALVPTPPEPKPKPRPKPKGKGKSGKGGKSRTPRGQYDWECGAVSGALFGAVH